MLPKKLMCTMPFCLIGLLAIILLTTAAGLEVEEKEIKPTNAYNINDSFCRRG